MPFSAEHIIRLDTVDSTNMFAQELLLNHNVVNSTVILSQNQTSGRGQRGSVWIAEPCTNLTFSVILFPTKFNVSKQFLLNKAFCLSVYDFLKIYDIKNVSIKWPNDLLVNGKKISGMLIENAIKGEYLCSVIAGFGINVNQNNFGSALGNIATSMRLEQAKKFNLEELFSEILNCIEKRYQQVEKGESALIDTDFNNALFQLNEWCVFEANNKEFIGCIRGVTELGQLIVELQDGTKQFFVNKEIRFKIFS